MMATHELSILGPMTAPDATGKVFFEPAESAMALATATLGTLLVCTIQAPAAAGDCGLYGNFTVPQNYIGTPVLVIRGYLGEAANSLGFGILYQPAIANSESLEQAFDIEDVVTNATWTGYVAEDLYETTITLTPAVAFAPGKVVNFFFFRDDSGDDQTGEFHIANLSLRYSDV